MDKNELHRHLQKCEKLQMRNRLKRCLYTVLFNTVLLLIILFWLGLLGDDIGDWVARAIFCFVFSLTSYLINYEIFDRIFEQERNEKAAIDYLKKRLSEKEQEDNYKKEML